MQTFRPIGNPAGRLNRMATEPGSTASGKPSAEPEPTAVRRPPRVLVVDDAPALLLLVTRFLERAGYEVRNTDNGFAAVELALSFRPDLVLMDVNLPGINGIEACRAIRLQAADAAPPIVMITGSDDGETLAQAYSAGATDYLRKPIDWRNFADFVGRFLPPEPLPLAGNGRRSRKA